MFILPKEEKKVQIKTNKNIFWFWARQVFDLAPTYFHLGWKISVT